MEVRYSDHVSYRVPRSIHRPMHRSLLDQPLTDTRPTCQSAIDRESTNVFIELPQMSAEVLTVTITGAYWSTTGGISVNYRQNVGRISFDSRARVYRYYVLIYRTILSTNISTYTRYYLPIYRPLLSTDTRYYRLMYRPIY